MALKPLLDSLDGLPADVAKEYAKRDDGKFLLAIDPVVDGDNGTLILAPVDKLKSALERERTNVQTLTNKVKLFEGLDPVAARAAITKLEEVKNWKPEGEIENRIKLIKEELATANASEKKALSTKLSRAEAQLKKTLVTNTAVTALQKAGGNVMLLLPHVERNIRMREVDSEDNPYLVEVINPDTGDVRVGDGSGNPMSIDQLILSFKERDEFASAFKASGASGSGAGSGARQSPQGGGSGSGSKRTIKTRDANVLGASLDDIANGTVTVDMSA